MEAFWPELQGLERASTDELDLTLDWANSHLASVKVIASKLARQGWKQWLRGALKGGAGQAHRFSKLTGQSDLDAPGPLTSDGMPLLPDEVLERAAADWSPFWQQGGKAPSELSSSVARLKSAAAEQALSLPPLSSSQVQQGIKSIAISTGLGLDFCQPHLARQLPEEGLT